MTAITRRDFLVKSAKLGVGLSSCPWVVHCAQTKPSSSFRKKMIILGIDGMDPSLVEQFVKEGVMPNFYILMNKGNLKRMASSIPPQSPVAWSDFAVGASAGVHGVFDFIHRDPKTMIPYFSTAEVLPAAKSLKMGGWEIPLSKGTARPLREGRPFWEYLSDSGIPTTIFKIPGDFPVYGKAVRRVSGMGTPDLLGTYGTFSFYTSSPTQDFKEIAGGTVTRLKIMDNKITSELIGPANPLKKNKPNVKIPFTVWRDPQNEAVKIKLQDHELLMTPGEWSDWIQLSFDLIPHAKTLKGICRILIKQVHPNFEMYVSPMNIDPTDQALPVTSPVHLGHELVDEVGWYGTKGLPADTKALSMGVLTEDDYIEQSGQILGESERLLDHELRRLKDQSSGVLFFYFSNIDQDSHMYWRALDRKHPSYSPALGARYSMTIQRLYIEMDRILGKVLRAVDRMGDDIRLIVMSDHGFAPFYRCVNLNTWLLDNGYTSLIDPHAREKDTFFENVNWPKTQAYGLGINALYLNREGREKYGTVSKHEVKDLIAKLKGELLQLKDPGNGRNAISNIWIGKEIFHREDEKTPDMIIGWNWGYRASWETILGGFSETVFADNTDKWSGDHCIDPSHVPAVLISNKKITEQTPSLPDVTATILAEYGIPTPRQMTGRPLYKI